MDFGKTGGMSTATLSQRRERRGQGESKREEKGKTKGGEGSNEHYDTVAAKGTEGQILYSLYI
jgi:hypothetical protein